VPGNDRLQRLSPLLLGPEQSHLAGTVVAKAHRLACLAIGSRSSKCRVIGLLTSASASPGRPAIGEEVRGDEHGGQGAVEDHELRCVVG